VTTAPHPAAPPAARRQRMKDKKMRKLVQQIEALDRKRDRLFDERKTGGGQ